MKPQTQKIPLSRVRKEPAHTFKKRVYAYHTKYGREWLPWRYTDDPYCVLVSEVMCQQTQVDRVAEKYTRFLDVYPDIRALASASLGDVLRLWQGLGYNRRAKMLHECARTVADEYAGVLPRSVSELIRLPGIGPYTAGAIRVFAHNLPEPLIETNIRSAYLYHFFANETGVSDTNILQHVEVTLDRKNPRVWFSALMDYGAYIKRTQGNQNVRSTVYTKQSSFQGSDRQVRGAILRVLTQGAQTRTALGQTLPCGRIQFEAQLERLVREGMIEKNRQTYRLPS